ncbi:hypothetical protein Tco_0556429 [Tanacetum coccineum]
MGNRIRTRNSPDILLGMILHFEFLSKSVLHRRQKARMSTTHQIPEYTFTNIVDFFTAVLHNTIGKTVQFYLGCTMVKIQKTKPKYCTGSQYADNVSEVEEVYDETATYMASTGFNVNKASKSGSGGENKSLYEQWKENHVEDPYDDDDFDDPVLTDAQMKFANTFDINHRGQLR